MAIGSTRTTRCRRPAAAAEGRPSTPTLFLHGENDPVVPLEVSRALAAQLPNATVHTFPGDLHDILN